ncbi:MAG: hypothetical protein E7422_01920 [Ruminococcaceae bacterium]|jgi:hypothetical protein|nr:hypothetical protein [Oscillospiraceae bacterium]
MYEDARSDALLLSLFLAFLALALAALAVSWIRGRQWGDLSSRRHYGESLTSDENKALLRSRRDCLIWAGISVISTALAFWMLRR